LEELSHAIKEWCAIVEALGKGLQILLCRKYPSAYDKLVLYPTYGFSNRKDYLSRYFQPEYFEFVEKSVESKKEGKTEIRYYAEVYDVMKVDGIGFESLRNLVDHYIWSPEHVFRYYSEDQKCTTAYLWILRVNELPEPQYIKKSGRGAIKYAILPVEISTKGARPVVGDSRFHSAILQIAGDLKSLDSTRVTRALS
jgi:hypothetical protein